MYYLKPPQKKTLTLRLMCVQIKTCSNETIGEKTTWVLTSREHTVGEGRVTLTAQAVAICVLPHLKPRQQNCSSH